MRIFIYLAAILAFAFAAYTQTAKPQPNPIRSTPAYAEVLLRKTELLSEAESLADAYTDEAPKMLDLRYEVAALDRFIVKMLAVKPDDAGRLTEALGKLMVRRASLDTDLNRLSRGYKDDHADVKKAKKRLEVFDAAIKEIIP